MQIKQTTIIVALLLNYIVQAKNLTIMLDPAGDAKQTGRVIEDSFERAITYDIAGALKEALEKEKIINCILTRSPGETVGSLQNAHFANRLPIDLYIRIQCCQATHEKHSLYLYFLSYNEQLPVKSNPFNLIPFDKAHLTSLDQSKKISTALANYIHHQHPHILLLHGPFGVPCTPLMGIAAPALCIEFSISKNDNWRPSIIPLAKSVEKSLAS